MKNSLTTIVLFSLILAAGCAEMDHHDTDESYLNKFVPDGEARRSTMMADAQASAGARDDGMLHAWDFDGKDLSPTGRAKLSSICEADSNEPIAIHLDVKHESFTDRKTSVVAFMSDKGIATSHLIVTEGINDATITPAAAGLAAYPKTDTSVEASAGSSANSNTASSSAK